MSASTIDFIAQYASLFFFFCALIAAVISEGFRKGKPPNHKLSQLYSWVAIASIFFAAILGGSPR